MNINEFIGKVKEPMIQGSKQHKGISGQSLPQVSDFSIVPNYLDLVKYRESCILIIIDSSLISKYYKACQRPQVV